MRSIARIALVGVLCASAAGGVGLLAERSRLGSTDPAAVQRVREELGRRFARAADALESRTAVVGAAPDAIRGAARDTNAARTLFERLAATLPANESGTAGLTVYGAGGTPLAWAGRVSDVPRDRVEGPAAVFVLLDPLGPRLVRVEPVPDPVRPNAQRLATIVAEQLVVERTDVATSGSDTFRLPTSVVDVNVRATPGLAPPQPPFSFAITGANGTVLAEADVSPADLAAVRAGWHDRIRAIVVGLLAMTVLLCAAPLLELRRHAARPGAFGGATVALVACLVAGRFLLHVALDRLAADASPALIGTLPDALLLAALVWLAIDTMERRRVSRPRPRLVTGTRAAAVAAVAGFGAAGAVATALLLAYEGTLSEVAARASQDLLHFSLHPFEADRLATAAGLVMLHAAVVWGAAGILRLPSILWRTPRRRGLRIIAAVSAVTGAALTTLLMRGGTSAIPVAPLASAVAAAGLAALLLARPRARARRASQAARLGLFFLGIVLPALALYPSLYAFSVLSKERLVSTQLAPQVASQREDLQVRRVPHTLETIDGLTTLPEFVTSSSDEAAPTTDRAFIVWSQTELAETRTTSAIELYGPNGRLVSRFALDLPEYAVTEYRGGSCVDWELYEEVSPFGSTLRNVLRASRAICRGRQRVGGIVVRAQLDYRALPFVTSPNPYLESLMPAAARSRESAFGSDVELAVYGWSRAPIFTSGPSVWPLDDAVFDRMVASREAMWQRVVRDGDAYRVYYFNDRGGIYALGYPTLTWLDHLVNLGELVFFCGALYAVLLLGATLFNLLTSQTPASGRALLREVRSSFYRKLFIAFVASSVVPVVVLALATSTYFANRFRAGVEESAVKTATVAQRLIEDYMALQQRGAGALDGIDDEFMLLVRRAIDEDVNLFEGPRLRATSERPLFASRLLPSRTPADVYREIVLERLPTTVVVEELAGAPGYLVAAAPVRSGGREAIVTVPQTLRQQDIEEQIDEIDRRVLSAAVLFVLLGAAIGYWMAERIADPVNRLTRATRRIARGDLDARIAATSSDELRRLVEDFNLMAGDLKKQRSNLERTQRLEAWADMARQVAHDIKNPLTPIQLSAEHARRVNVDKGRPLSPALDECVDAILSQVALLREISAEFSSFASSPTARPEPADIGALLDEVVEPYRTALRSRVPITVEVEPGLPQAFIDRTLFGRALTNVIENALHAMPGAGTLNLRAAIDRQPVPDRREAAFIAVSVTDSGIGMDAEALGRIFEPYFSTKATGTGLGLTIAKRNVELFGGTIEVDSERGIGTTVTMRVPVAAA